MFGIKNMKLNVFYFLLLAIQFALPGCRSDIGDDLKTFYNSTNWQLAPDSPEEKEVRDISFSYIIPEEIIKDKPAEELFQFKPFHYEVSTKQEKLFIEKRGKLWKIERRTDNGSVGSGKVFHIEIIKQHLGHSVKVTFLVKKESKYQQGLVFPFSVPEFDIKKYLASASIPYTFELDSKYDIASIKANFNRLLEKKAKNRYFFKSDLAHYNSHVDFYPYRGGAKAVINATISNIKTQEDVVKVSELLKDLKAKMFQVMAS